MAYNPKDFYFKKAKQENYAARSAFKLEEMDQRYRLFKSGQTVLDLGCAPGSWSQYISKKIGDHGKVIGIDLSPVRVSLSNGVFYEADIFEEATFENIQAELQIKDFDHVLSDMAPKTTGVRIADQERSLLLCQKAFEVAQARLKTGGHFVVKIFQSGDTKSFVNELKKHFERVEISRPKSVRESSFEIYILGLGFKRKTK